MQELKSIETKNIVELRIESSKITYITDKDETVVIDTLGKFEAMSAWFNDFVSTLNTKQPNLKKLGIESVYEKNILPKIARMLEENTSLEELDMIKVFPSETETDALADALKTNQFLKKLNISSNRLKESGVAAIAKALEENSTLRALNISENSSMEPGGSIAIAKMLKVNRALFYLNLESNGIDDRGIGTLADALHSNWTLKSLVLAWNQISATGAKTIANTLNQNKALEELNISQNAIKDGALPIINTLGLNRLKSLNLSSTELSSAEARGLNILKTNTSLKHLNIGRNSDLDLIELAKAMANNSSLEYLNLEDTLFNPSEFIKQLCQSLTRDNPLVTLNLSDCRLTDKDVELLTTTLIQNPGCLKNLKLNENNFAVKGIKALAQMCEAVPLNKLHLINNPSQADSSGLSAMEDALKHNHTLRDLWIEDYDHPDQHQESKELKKVNGYVERNRKEYEAQKKSTQAKEKASSSEAADQINFIVFADTIIECLDKEITDLKSKAESGKKPQFHKPVSLLEEMVFYKKLLSDKRTNLIITLGLLLRNASDNLQAKVAKFCFPASENAPDDKAALEKSLRQFVKNISDLIVSNLSPSEIMEMGLLEEAARKLDKEQIQKRISSLTEEQPRYRR